MTTTYVPYFCNVCNNLLDPYDMMTLNVRCTRCFKTNNMSSTDRTMAVMTYQAGVRTLQPSELLALSNLQTTQRIKKECTQCKFDTMILTVDENYKFNYVCIKCKTLYS